MGKYAPVSARTGLSKRSVSLRQGSRDCGSRADYGQACAGHGRSRRHSRCSFCQTVNLYRRPDRETR
ncbi:hypothetical protein EQW76_16685 [Rhizobium sp. rho-13.1]|nr:hypothetical protein EQW76_16685 [Rhizobium sp. rho-13.1]TQY11474.1 hypothetical protein EQW74_18000 [Rhizobium sp. rho-1.1]